ncbi:BPTI/Kunitz domain-containing protein 4-like [Pecten maximus]|uniref:BPTI/Kunitz domain-containing protein 4-like n=1 Tax=Pecten maximus TaxID=6579 RepID=UPI001457E9A1|nr:BPTI/Kunitz domain-containing protein 4-like [Pecten maximus]
MNSLLPLLLVAGLSCVYGASLDGLLCGPVCMIYCKFGNVEDDRGCPLCRCKPDPALAAMKTATETPTVQSLELKTPQSVCPMVMCMIYCPTGNLLGSDGCPKCACNPY